MELYPGENEAVRVLDELVCEAVPQPFVPVSQGPSCVGGRGENEGVQVSAASPKTRFRWRIIPVTLLGIFGVTCVLGSAIYIHVSIRFWHRWPAEAADCLGAVVAGLVGGISGIPAGGLFVATAVLLQKGRWRGASLAFVSAILLYVPAALFMREWWQR